jgi:hypothetical protein
MRTVAALVNKTSSQDWRRGMHRGHAFPCNRKGTAKADSTASSLTARSHVIRQAECRVTALCSEGLWMKSRQGIAEDRDCTRREHFPMCSKTA